MSTFLPCKPTFMFAWLIWITIIRSNEIISSTRATPYAGIVSTSFYGETQQPQEIEPTIEPLNQSNSWHAIFVQLNNINVLLWIIIGLITVICCLCGTMCGFAFNRKLKNPKALAKDTLTLSTIAVDSDPLSISEAVPPLKNFRSFSSEIALQPPSMHQSTSRSASTPTIRSSSVDPSLHTHQKLHRGQHASPRSFTERKLRNLSLQDSEIALTIPTSYDVETASDITHITAYSNGTETQKTDPVSVAIEPRYNRAHSQPAKMYHQPLQYVYALSYGQNAAAANIPPPPPMQTNQRQISAKRVQLHLQHALQTLAINEGKNGMEANIQKAHILSDASHSVDVKMMQVSPVPLQEETSTGSMGMMNMFGNDSMDQHAESSDDDQNLEDAEHAESLV